MGPIFDPEKCLKEFSITFSVRKCTFVEFIITFIFQLSIEDQCDLDDIYSFNRWEDSDLERI